MGKLTVTTQRLYNSLYFKFNSFVAHMLYAWSFNHNIVVSIDINGNKYFISLNTYTTVFSWRPRNSNKNTTLLIILIIMTKLKSIQFKWNPKTHHCNHKRFILFLLKLIYQIKLFVLNLFIHYIIMFFHWYSP